MAGRLPWGHSFSLGKGFGLRAGVELMQGGQTMAIRPVILEDELPASANLALLKNYPLNLSPSPRRFKKVDETAEKKSSKAPMQKSCRKITTPDNQLLGN